MEHGVMYESIQSVARDISIPGLVVINILLIILILLFLEAACSGIRRITRKNYILKKPMPKIIGTLVLYSVFVILEASVLL